jgi:hypothetical protein
VVALWNDRSKTTASEYRPSSRPRRDAVSPERHSRKPQEIDGWINVTIASHGGHRGRT